MNAITRRGVLSDPSIIMLRRRAAFLARALSLAICVVDATWLDRTQAQRCRLSWRVAAGLLVVVVAA